MNLIDENEEKEQAESKKKTLKIILISIAVLVVLAIVIIIFSVVKNNNTLKLQVNDSSVNLQSGLVLMSDSKNVLIENDQIYLSVRKLVSTLGGEYYNDEYKNKGEDTTKCYIKMSNEYTSYISNSSLIYKAVVVDDIADDDVNNQNTTNQSKNNTKKDEENTEKTIEYEYFNIDNGVKYIDGEIYASQEAIELGFNVIMGYNAKNKTISIYTLDALEKIAGQNVNLAVVGDDCEYYNKKLLKYGLVLIRNSDGDYGIANYNDYQEGNYIVSCKYSKIRFCESSSTIIVTTSDDSKQGILKLDLVNKNKADTKIEPKYDLIKLIDEKNDLYLIKENGRYGVIKLSGDEITTVIKTEYQKIGIDGELYDEMDNKYIIDDKYIPIKIDNKWGLATTEGKVIINPQYYGIGCNLGKVGSGDPVIILPKLIEDSDGIVFVTTQTEDVKLYSVIDVKTGTKVGNQESSEIYSKFDNNQRKYYMKITDVATGTVIGNINIYNVYGKKSKVINNANEANNVMGNNVVINNSLVTNTVPTTNTITNTVPDTTNQNATNVAQQETNPGSTN